jgi:hypothetical protein
MFMFFVGVGVGAVITIALGIGWIMSLEDEILEEEDAISDS